MRTFLFYTTDSRYSVPTLTFVTVADEARARVVALQKLAESEHYRSIEVCEDDEVVFVVGRDER